MTLDEGAVKVAIIGGGCAGVATAFELTRPEHGGRYQVTLYQVGWRLGGKGASGRGRAQRVEEHGLHLWMGFYENAFRLMRECYAELGRDPKTCPIATWEDAFEPDHFSGVADWSPSGRWVPWRVSLPPFPGLPGDPENKLPRWTVADYLARSVTLLRTLLDAVRVKSGEGPTAPVSSPKAAGPGTPEAYLEGMARFLKFGQLATLAAVVEALHLMEVILAAFRRTPENLFLRFHDAVAGAILAQLERFVSGDDEIRRLWEIVDLVLAVVRGSVRFRLLTDPRGFDAINDYDCREWLRLSGASERAVNSAFVRALYDLAFAYEDGDVRRPRIAAGQALRGSLRAFFTYRGAFFWKMQAGMGDVVFAPFYEVLRRRGVRFAFFHRLENVVLARSIAPGERPHVEALEMDVQAEVEGGEYQPLIDVNGLPCWPSEPDFAQLVGGERLRAEGVCFESAWDRRKVGTRTLRVGEDFDFAVLAVGVGAVRHVTKELTTTNPRWKTMLDNAKSVPTQAFQIWLSADMKELGWAEDPINISGFVEPFDTWADMTHLAPVERWATHPSPPRAIAYFCSVLPDVPEAEREAPAFPHDQREVVRRNAVRFLDRDVVHLWPNAQGAPGQFRWELLVEPQSSEPPAEGRVRFASQFWTANVNPTDRYALSLPGTLEHRISPLDTTYDNFTIAGDWTDCAFNEGCVEAAVMSGRLAAHALSGAPLLEEIVGFDHP
jgi:uncharacterized protein with NAD-binding domain and iron-sulfur cluster